MIKTPVHIINRFRTYKRQLMRLLMFVVGSLFGIVCSNAQCTIACNDSLQVGLNAQGVVLITPAMLLQGSGIGCTLLGVELYDEGVYIGTSASCDEAGKVIIARLVNYENNAFCDTYLTVLDNQAPVLTCPDLFIECNAPSHPDSIGYPIVQDNCNTYINSDLTYFDQVNNLPCFENFNGNIVTARIDRTWLVSDDAGNQSVCVQKIHLLRSTLSDVELPSNFSGSNALTCSIDDPLDFNVTGEPLIAGRPFSNAGLCEISMIHSDQVFNTCGGGITIIRKWTLIDECTTSTIVHDQIIEVQDQIPPNIECSLDLTISAKSFDCSADIDLPIPIASDECSDFEILPSWEFGSGYGPFLDVPVGTHIVTYLVRDACGNESICTMEVNIIDNSPPTPICENSISVSLQPSGEARIYASTFDEGTIDNCGIDRFEVSRDGLPFGDFVEFYCGDVGLVPVLVQFRAFDINGMFNDCWITVSVNDNFAPSLTCPSEVTLDCLEDVNNLALTGMPAIVEVCGLDTLFYSDTPNLNCGVGNIAREWVAVDIHGNSSSCIQNIIVEDTTELSIVYPEDIEIDFCSGAIDSTFSGSPIISGVGCKNILINYEDRNFSSNSHCYTILRTWTVINWCVYDPNSGSSEGSYSYVQKLDIVDNTSPIVFCTNDTLVQNMSLNCTGVYIDLPLPYGEDCSGSVFVTNNSLYADSNQGSASGTYPNGIHSIQYLVNDNCGNSTECSITLEVVDGLAPNLICNGGIVVNISTDGFAFMDPSIFIASVSDNCTAANDLSYSLSPSVFTCDNVGFNSVNLTVTDEQGNESTCTTTVEIQDNFSVCTPSEVSLSGKVLDYNGSAASGIEVQLNSIYFETTNSNGEFEFINLDSAVDYLVEVNEDVDILDGVTTFDIVMIAQHVLQRQLFTNPYQMIAADIDNSNSISIFDLLGIRQIILEERDAYTSNQIWKFIDANYIFSDPLNPFNETYPQNQFYGNLMMDIDSANFIAVKLGDVNADNSNFKGSQVLTRGYEEKYIVDIIDAYYVEGQMYTVDLIANKEVETLGAQFEIDFNPAFLSIENVISKDIEGVNSSNFVVDNEKGKVRFSWNTMNNNIQIDKESNLFSLKIKMKKVLIFRKCLSCQVKSLCLNYILLLLVNMNLNLISLTQPLILLKS